MTWILAFFAGLGIYWIAMGGLIVLWALYCLVRLPYDLSQDGRE